MQSNPVFHQIVEKHSEVTTDKVISELAVLLEKMVKRECETKTMRNIPMLDEGFSELIEEMSKIQDEKIHKLQ
jgi:hypothetical protein